jgi:serine/threonine-protein kinase PknG
MTACTQPGCTGTIVDDYCDVCGSPVGAVPLVPTEAAGPAGSPARADVAGLPAVGAGSGCPPKP